MEQLKLENESVYDLVPGGVVDPGNDKLQVIVLAGLNSFSEIESNFGNEFNTQKIRILDTAGENMIVKNDYTYLESITKKNDYAIRSEEYIDENDEKNYQDITDTVYIIVLSKPDLRAQVKNLQATVDVLVLDGLEV